MLTSRMATLTLNNGVKIPWYAFGTGTALYQQDAAAQVEMAIRNGVTHLDGAQMYQNEESLGQGIRAAGKPRSELYVTTKLAGPPAAGATIRQTLEESLKKLGTEYVDLFLIHSPSPFNQEAGGLKKAWKEMEELHKAGLAKSIGVSNFRVEDLKEVLDGCIIPPVANQVRIYATSTTMWH
jgi:diketogulonate reductase-like aldo/keto reductase